MQKVDIIAKSLVALYIHTSDFIKIKKENREIYVKTNSIKNINRDRLLAKVVKEQLQDSLFFLCALKVNKMKDKYA